ncbi:glycosyltransferase [Nocardia wallacei]|uniref:glycosyltransferase n=1 Tax=Nocardia wallacei TaxID=480035 RepID=UPI0024570FE0|nr:glycosyltransferase [Nocardia wallacei]
MKIVILAVEAVVGWGGSEELWADTARAALAAGHEVWFTPRVDPRGYEEPLNELVASGATELPRRSWTDPDGRVHAEMVPAELADIVSRADVLFVSIGSLRYLLDDSLVNLIQNAGVPVAATIQLISETELLPDALRERARRVIGLFEALVVPAHRSLATLQRILAARLDHGVVLPSPIRRDLTGPVAWPDSAVPTMACVARLSPIQKGHDLLLEVLSDPLWKGRRWALNFVGRGRADRYLAELAAFYGLADRLTLTGFQRDMQAVWSQNHMLVLPSREESMPIAIMEAMFCARPCLVTDVGDNARLITDGVNGYVAEGDRPAALAAALDRAWDGRHDWKAMGQRAFETYVADRDPTPGKTVLSLLESVSTGGPGRTSGDG